MFEFFSAMYLSLQDLEIEFKPRPCYTKDSENGAVLLIIVLDQKSWTEDSKNTDRLNIRVQLYRHNAIGQQANMKSKFS